MQLLATFSDEFVKTLGLNVIPGNVSKILLSTQKYRLPHVGWNDLFMTRDCVLWENIPEDALFYYNKIKTVGYFV